MTHTVWRCEHTNPCSNRGKEPFLITNLFEKHTHYPPLVGFGWGDLVGVLSSGPLPAHGAASGKQYVWGALDAHQWPEVPFLTHQHLPLIWIWGPCCYRLVCFALLEDRNGLGQKKQLFTRMLTHPRHTPGAHPVSVLTLWRTRLLQADCSTLCAPPK